MAAGEVLNCGMLAGTRMSRFEDTVVGLIEALVPEPEDRVQLEEVARFVLAQYGRMPEHLRWPMWVLTRAFDEEARVLRRRPFRRLSPSERRAHIAAWKGSRLSPRRDLVRFYESLALYHWHWLRA